MKDDPEKWAATMPKPQEEVKKEQKRRKEFENV